MNNQDRVRSLDEMITEFLDKEHYPAISYGIVKDNQILFTGEY